jgi:hypothetical protein
LLFELQIFWVDSIVTRPVSATQRRWGYSPLAHCYILEVLPMHCDNLNFVRFFLQNVNSHIYDRVIFLVMQNDIWMEALRTNIINQTEQYIVTRFAVPLRKMNFSVVSGPQVKL